MSRICATLRIIAAEPGLVLVLVVWRVVWPAVNRRCNHG